MDLQVEANLYTPVAVKTGKIQMHINKRLARANKSLSCIAKWL